MKLFMNKIWEFIKTRFWYIILLGLSSAYVWYYRFDIYELNELNARNLIFILWLILLLLPLFSEMEFLGVKIKKEVQKETKEVKGLLQKLQMQVNQLQMTNSVANNINLSNAALPSEQKLEELLQRVTELQSAYPNSSTKVNDSISKEEDKNVYLFKVRLDIETSLREICEKIGHVERMTITIMMKLLNRAEVLNGMTCDLINQVNKIANRGIHGEIVSTEYLDFVEKTYPEIMRQIQDASSRLEYRTWTEI